MKYLSMIGAALLILAASTSCRTNRGAATGGANSGRTTISNTQDMSRINPLLYSEWLVTEVNGEAVTGDERPYVGFDTVASNPFLAKFYAYNGCNVINGQVAVTGGGSMKKASDYLSTLRFCPSAPYEVSMSLCLDHIASYRIQEVNGSQTLYLFSENQAQSMVLRRATIDFLEGAWRVSRIGDVIIDPDKNIDLVIDMREKHLHGNAGCNVLNGDILTNPDSQFAVQFSNVATTRMMCPDIDLEQTFLAALDQVRSARVGTSSQETDLLDASGKLIITLQRLDLKSGQQGEGSN